MITFISICAFSISFIALTACDFELCNFGQQTTADDLCEGL